MNHESGIHINRNILEDIQGRKRAENTGDDNFRTVKLVSPMNQQRQGGQSFWIVLAISNHPKILKQYTTLL